MFDDARILILIREAKNKYRYFHPGGSLGNLDFIGGEGDQDCLTIAVYEKLHFQAYTNKLNVYLKNKTVQVYFKFRRFK